MEELNELNKALLDSWDRETCYPASKNDWSPNHPYLGQCAVTSLIVQDYFGGDILYSKELNHFWNILPSGKIIDLTRKQFPIGTSFKIFKISSREDILDSRFEVKSKTRFRYEILKTRLEQSFSMSNAISY